MAKKIKHKPSALWHIKYWPIWFLVGVLWLITRLPYEMQLKIGSFIGRLIMRFSKSATAVTTTNIQLCFPQLNKEQQKQLITKNFESLGMGIIETALGWWAPSHKIQHLGHGHHFEYLTDALKEGRGALLITAHFNSLYLVGRLISHYFPCAVMYHAQTHPVLTKIIEGSIKKYFVDIIRREDIRGMIRCLNKNVPIWYMPDVDAGLRNSVFAPFMGVPAATVTATARFAQITNTPVIPCFFYRRDDGQGYEGTFLPPLENYPSGDEYQDALRINQCIDEAIHAHPEQYLWQYKRFKTRPVGEEKIYQKIK